MLDEEAGQFALTTLLEVGAGLMFFPHMVSPKGKAPNKAQSHVLNVLEVVCLRC